MPEPVLAITSQDPDPAESSPAVTAMQPLAVAAVTVEQAAAMFGVSRSAWYHAERSGRIGPEPLQAFGSSRRYDVAELRAWSAAGTPPRTAWLETKPKSVAPI